MRQCAGERFVDLEAHTPVPAHLDRPASLERVAAPSWDDDRERVRPRPWSGGRYRTTAGMSPWCRLRSKPSASWRALISTLTVPSPFFVTALAAAALRWFPARRPSGVRPSERGGDRRDADDRGTSGPSCSREVAAPARPSSTRCRRSDPEWGCNGRMHECGWRGRIAAVQARVDETFSRR